jgi:hypothetical protein
MTGIPNAAALLRRPEPAQNLEVMPLDRLSTFNGAGNFSVEEQRKLIASVQELAVDVRRISLAYDITAVRGNQPIYTQQHEEIEPAAAIVLRSRNFGYDFALVKAEAGTSLFGMPRQGVLIYRSRLGENNFTRLQMAASLAKALTLIDRMYCQAAELHYP